MWGVFYKYKLAKEIKNRIIVRAGPYDRPSGAWVIIDLNEHGPRTEQDALRTLHAMAAELHEMGAQYGESVTVKVTYLSKPSIPPKYVEMEKAFRATT